MTEEKTGFPVSRSKRPDELDDKSTRYQRAQRSDDIDKKYGFIRYTDSVDRMGWLINMHPADILDEDERLISAVDFYFIEEDGGHFKVSYPYQPYFYIQTSCETQREASSFLSRKLSGRLAGIDMVEKENLDLSNHLVGLRTKYLKLRFHTVDDLIKAKRDIMPAVKRNREREKSKSAYDPSLFTGGAVIGISGPPISDQMDNIIDMREYDVPYHVRVAIDNKINVGHWYMVKGCGLKAPEIKLVEEEPDRPEPVVMAFDIETTKLPLKFPDSASDVIMMISYMIDGQGYLITNREVVGEDVEDFEYTPKPEYEGPFIVFNEPDEVSLIRRFFDHVLEVKPTIISTFNGDSFDWPFVSARAEFHGLSMQSEIGFIPDSQNEYKCRPCIHMDAFRWVKRDSYLPVGSQNLKATTRAKLRYDPVELDPEDMCRMASEQPQILANYSVSDAVATYYLYMKYVHPFIFALCTIIPMEPDEVLRKGSGTLCEALLMVQAYHGNIVFPNKQEMVFNKLTEDGHVLDCETYVGGHVEALESGVFRSDIPSRFRISPDMIQQLIDSIEQTMRRALEAEENIPLEQVTDFDEVCGLIKDKLSVLKENPLRVECPMIYHLDVGAMYPNIILTNRLQPPAIVDEVTCASCDFNKPGATCQRRMNWKWRGDYMPASRNEYQSIRLQLESETFPGFMPGDNSRSFHHLPPMEQAALEKKRLADYCRRAYKRVKHTREEVRQTTVCQRENSFYVDTVRAFRDRRYTFKGLLKSWKKKLEAAKQKNDPAEIKSCKNKEILYDSLQLAHKCILNSFYGYVMRKGARWYSMEMAGIVCYTGANIITKAREIVELIGRPLELDTDGIWCILPLSFPENFEFHTINSKKPKVTVSYPGAMLNIMVQDHFTNHQYQELTDHSKLEYEQRSENSIFFEVDGPYRAMILPASKEEGKRLKKRYAVFNEDGTLAELKGFEVKRRGELQLIKNFQSSVFEAFLNGTTLQECYESVGTVANFWLDVLYNKAGNMPDSELFELISENRNMSRKLEDYGNQKSSSIMTAKRLAEFLGDQMVKDAGLSCRFIIARKPEGAPVTERAIPLAIFQAEPSVSRHYLSKWLKCSKHDDFDIRNILDWKYYIERLGNAIQKIVTIPATIQGVSNPVPRVAHPPWLHKRLLEKNDIYKQQKISDMFSVSCKTPDENEADNNRGTKRSHDQEEGEGDIEECVGQPRGHTRATPSQSQTTPSQSRTTPSQSHRYKSWKELLGNPPPVRWTNKSEFLVWLKYHKKKWDIQKMQRKERQKDAPQFGRGLPPSNVSTRGNISGFLRQRNMDLIELPWQIIQVADTATPGEFNLWVLAGRDMHQVKLSVPRVFYVNSRSAREPGGVAAAWRYVSKSLPRSVPTINLYEYSVPETTFKEHAGQLATQLSSPDIEGVYEANVPLDFRVVVSLGCVCTVNKNYRRMVMNGDIDNFGLNQLDFRTVAQYPYLEGECLKMIFIYHSNCDTRSMFGVFHSTTGHVFPMDTVRTNQMPNVTTLYQNERNSRVSRVDPSCPLPPEEMTFDIRIETQHRVVYRSINRVLMGYKDGHHGPTVVLVQSEIGISELRQSIPALDSFPVVHIPTLDNDSNYPVLDWQRPVTRRMVNQYLSMPTWFQNHLQQARYGHIPIGNLPTDPTAFIADVFFSRNLIRHNHITWATPSDKPDLGGHEDDDYRLMIIGEAGAHSGSLELNTPGLYPSTCVEITLDGLAVNAVLQSSHINDYEGGSGTSTSFDYAPQSSLEDLMSGNTPALTVYDEAALCSNAFKVLRSLVLTWISEVSSHKNYYADLQLQHFYRWIQNSSSYLFEPAICRMIHKLMKKLFMQLISEFKRLGASVVYADFNRIFLCTKKRRVDDACAYVQFILNSIQSRQLFQSVHFEPKACWHMLLWMDKANYSGISCPLPKQLEFMCNEEEMRDSQQPSVDDSVMETDEPMYELETNWNICKYLPEDGSCQEIFKVIIAGHIQALYGHLVEAQREFEPGQTPVQRRAGSSQTQGNQDNSIMASSVSFAQNRIEHELSEKLFLITQKMKQTLGIGTEMFPKLPGSHLHLINPALEFIKCICKGLSLDTTTQHQIAKLRHDLLKLIGVREFSEEAVFQDPCCSYILPGVICESCNGCRDIDLCRDPYIIDENTDRPMWYCSLCGNRYNYHLIEECLINTLQNRSIALVVQDLVCTKCQGVKESNMAEYCSCAGNFTETVQAKEFNDLLITFKNISEHFKLSLLHETVVWFMQNS